MKRIRFKLNVSLRGFCRGGIISLEVDVNNVPVDRYWRKRFIDSKIDKCMKIIDGRKIKTNKEEQSEEKYSNKRKKVNIIDNKIEKNKDIHL